MNRYKMVVLSNPFPGREDEYNTWYQHTHLADIVALPGFRAAQRFRLTQNMMIDGEAYRYMAIYDIETDNLERSLAALVSAAESGELDMSDALDAANAYAAVYDAFGDVVRELSSDR